MAKEWGNPTNISYEYDPLKLNGTVAQVLLLSTGFNITTTLHP